VGREDLGEGIRDGGLDKKSSSTLRVAIAGTEKKKKACGSKLEKQLVEKGIREACAVSNAEWAWYDRTEGREMGKEGEQ